MLGAARLLLSFDYNTKYRAGVWILDIIQSENENDVI
jgi:hypothetical protein